MAADLVSVVMTAYNGRRFIADAIKSVLAQTYADFEFVIVDDASTDDTVALIESFRDRRIRLIRNQSNQGISTSRNLGMQNARGDFIAPHDQDDISAPDRLNRQVAALEADPTVVLVGGRVRVIPEGSLWPALPLPSPAALAWRLFTGSPLQHSAICFRTETQRRHDLYYRALYHYAEDFELYHRFSDVGRIMLLTDVLGSYRYHEANTSRTRSAAMDQNGKVFLLARYREYLGQDAVDEEAIDRVWRLAVRSEPAANSDELSALGQLLDAHVSAFLACRGFTGNERDEVLSEAAAVWWRIVRAGAMESGPHCLALFGKYPNLSYRVPSPAARVAATTQAAGRHLLRALGTDVLGRSK